VDRPREGADLRREWFVHAQGAGDGLIALNSFPTPEGAVRLASPINNEDFARQLYSALREADAQGIDQVIVIQPDGSDIAIAIRDRLKRAAAGR
jgi:L-threonylcarbamoyladenylate synthase